MATRVNGTPVQRESQLHWPEFPSAGMPQPESVPRRRWIQSVAVGALLSTLGYLIWRTLSTINGTALYLSLPMLVLEVHALLSLGLYTADMWNVDVHPLRGEGDPARYRIAVLIPTYNEGREVLLPTIAAAVALEPAHDVWVLDDGEREWVRVLALSLGARYQAREEHTHAKAGNINALLPLLEVDLVAIFDADHVAHANFLKSTVGYFDDPLVAIVQTPQDFYNLDSFEHVTTKRGRRFGEQELFYRVLSAGRNRWGAAFWCGTNAVVRLSALRAVGGVSTESITEDIHTTIKMHRLGYRSVYHNEVLARGLAASNSQQYLSQRLRWGTGAMQVLRRENPLFVSGLRPMQRAGYMSTLLGWFDSWRTLGYVLLPIGTVLTGGLPIRAPFTLFLTLFAGTFLIQRGALLLMGRGRAPFLQSTIFEFVRLPANLLATTALFSRRAKPFTVTSKGRSGAERKRMPAPLLLRTLLAVHLAALLWYCCSEAGLTPTHYGTGWVAAGAAMWMVFNGGLLTLATMRIRHVQFGSDRRAAVRFELEGRVGVNGISGQLRDISLTGARVSLPHSGIQVGETLTLSLPVCSPPIHLPARVCMVREHEGESTLGLEYVDPPATLIAALTLALFRTGSAPQLVDERSILEGSEMVIRELRERVRVGRE